MDWSKTAIAITIILFIGISSASSYAAEYYCKATKKIGFENTYTPEMMKKYQYATKVEESNGEAFLSRCSYSASAGKITCDRYKVDRIEFDSNVKIKKYYVFNSQFNFQIFANLNSLEDNGRGGIQFGKCKIVSP